MTAEQRVAQIRDIVPDSVAIGISGDAFAAAALNGCCDVWYSVIAGTLPEPALAITRAALAGDHARAQEESAGLDTAWITRDAEAEYPAPFRQPTVTAHCIPDLAEQLRVA